MLNWMRNGCQLGWLIAVEKGFVEVYKEDESVNKKMGFERSVKAGKLLPGFELELGFLNRDFQD